MSQTVRITAPPELDAPCACLLRAEVGSWPAGTAVLVDLRQTWFLDPEAVRVLLWCRDRQRAGGGSFQMLPSRTVSGVLGLCGAGTGWRWDPATGTAACAVTGPSPAVSRVATGPPRQLTGGTTHG